MKKVYSKPMLVFESFELMESIAAECQDKVQANEHTCFVEFGDKSYFIVGACKDNGYDDPFLCYNVPTASNSLFGS